MRGVKRLHPEGAASERGAEKLESRAAEVDALGELLDWLPNRCQPPPDSFEVEGAWRGVKPCRGVEAVSDRRDPKDCCVVGAGRWALPGAEEKRCQFEPEARGAA